MLNKVNATMLTNAPPVTQIELERNLPLQERGIRLVVDEDRSVPSGQEEWFACLREHPAPTGFA
jgi:hypothetical protein